MVAIDILLTPYGFSVWSTAKVVGIRLANELFQYAVKTTYKKNKKEL